MRYFAFILKAEIMIIGLLMMYFNQVVTSPPFMSWVAIFSIGLYLALQGIYGKEFTGCVLVKPKEPVKKWLFR